MPGERLCNGFPCHCPPPCPLTLAHKSQLAYRSSPVDFWELATWCRNFQSLYYHLQGTPPNEKGVRKRWEGCWVYIQTPYNNVHLLNGDPHSLGPKRIWLFLCWINSPLTAKAIAHLFSYHIHEKVWLPLHAGGYQGSGTSISQLDPIKSLTL